MKTAARYRSELLLKTAAICAVLLLFSCSHDAGYGGTSVDGYGGRWTTVVYMAADNDLEGDAVDDVREMLAGAAGLEKAGQTVLILLDRSAGYSTAAGNWSDTRLFKLKPAAGQTSEDFSFVQIDCPPLGLSRRTLTELDMSASDTLKSVLRFAQQEYSAAHYALVMWGHGCGWRGYAVDDASDGIMMLPSLHEAVSGLETPLSVIAFDCCYGAMLETAYELRNDAQFLVATERDEPAAGWNYTYFLQNLAQKAEGAAAGFSGDWYARCAVNAYGRQYADTRNSSITAVRLQTVEDVFSSFDAFSRECAAAVTTREAAIAFSSDILGETSAFLTGEYPAYRFADVDSLASVFLEKGLPQGDAVHVAAVSVQAGLLRETLKQATLVSFSGGDGFQEGLSEKPLLAVYVSTVRTGGVVETDYPQFYIRGSGTGSQCSFVRDSTGWVPQHLVSQSTSLLDHLYRMPLP